MEHINCVIVKTALTLECTLAFWVKVSADKFVIFFLIFPRKQALTFHANCPQWRQFACMKSQNLFLGKK